MTHKKITSLTNSGIKRVVQLRDRKTRLTTGLTIVEGVREITQAQEAGVVFKELYMCQELLVSTKISDIAATSGRNSKVPVYEISKAIFSKIAYGDRAEGVLAVCAPATISFKDLSKKRQPLYVIVEGVEKPGNLGAILRTCDAAGVDGVIVCDGKTDIYNPNVIRASLGVVFSVKVIVSSNNEAIKFLRSQNVMVCATWPKAKMLYTKIKFNNALAIVVGSEQNGLSKFWNQHADYKVKIPMNGRADSLNVSATTAILLYEIIRQRSN